MVAHDPSEGDPHPGRELGSELREAVQAVLHDEVPPDWAEETLKRLRRHSPRTAPRRSPRFDAWIALAAAAGIVAVVLLGGSRLLEDGQEVGSQSPQRREETPVVVQSDVVQPTLWAYRQAARQSPEALDELLDKHAARLLPRSAEPEPDLLWREFL